MRLISVDGQGQHNPDWSEDLWGKAVRPSDGITKRPPARLRTGVQDTVSEDAKGGGKQSVALCMPGAGLNSVADWKAPSEMSALKPYRGKPAVRNFREGYGNGGIIEARLAP